MKSTVISLSLLILTSCSHSPVVFTEIETRGGEELRQVKLAKTGSRKDVPKGEKPRQVVAQSSFSHRGTKALISISKGFWPWSDVTVATNCLRCHKDEPIPWEQPKDPWYKLPALIGAEILLVAVIVLWILNKPYQFSPLNFLKKIFLK